MWFLPIVNQVTKRTQLHRTCESGCSSDEQCASSEVCSKGNCVDPCSAGQLGAGAACGECAR